VTALDIHKPYLEQLVKRAKEANLHHKIKAVAGSMNTMDFKPESLDLIWAEGAIYHLGFERGLTKWKRYLKKDGYMVISELSWLKDKPAREPKAFWDENHSEMRTVEKNTEITKGLGYRFIGSFPVPQASWWANYYNPILKRIEELRIKYASNQRILEKLNREEDEIYLYRKYPDNYGYVFYIMQK
jgi:SAM-dependent methyltransferase